MQKSKNTRMIENGRIYIMATFNNTLITITDEKGSPIVVDSSGMHGFSGTRKSTPHAATVTAGSAIQKAIEKHNLRKVDVFVKGIGQGREAALRVIKSAELDIDRIVDMTPLPHNGVRPPKIRRV
ncbi:30S ribosomal protein S11 [Candidatus Roizmanbacteria bacterium RIFCSPHIGHO2_12_FULL_41_11]|uniref:Small ribosomal subunit protein uS11 n=3 Tax=Candidatus Roizmaniibacteriota TaxID=1752723 RepID=A0A1F7JS52_9BACT|nr:MAG: 30S ribosomal protein S11 [Candidatus Roizmanbacteria bacterium RIFCSPHIGHO2_12_FULL_41_11]OGK51342.1 MAG: 30S ribosomal protein S11 [Candidatus Roizmanbacteria bacterium RIFCSPLOWO2_01_FULL_41_22]OGK58442.1 MAG: 30S ribosomal protein S11 [Candidatus Roizmanbacteria bacterium RIFCSPLOWO2_02_FULL_41_9]